MVGLHDGIAMQGVAVCPAASFPGVFDLHDTELAPRCNNNELLYTDLYGGFMLCNVNKLDRVVRALFAVVLIGATVYFVPSAVPKTLLLTAAVLLLMSAWFGVCYIYKLLGVSTAKPKSST
jgi:hypothetical protein